MPVFIIRAFNCAVICMCVNMDVWLYEKITIISCVIIKQNVCILLCPILESYWRHEAFFVDGLAHTKSWHSHIQVHRSSETYHPQLWYFSLSNWKVNEMKKKQTKNQKFESYTIHWKKSSQIDVTKAWISLSIWKLFHIQIEMCTFVISIWGDFFLCTTILPLTVNLLCHFEQMINVLLISFVAL